jgi:hypothetical protein
VLSVALPANSFDLRTNPLPSSTMPRVTSAQSERFSFERPRAALAFPAAVPSKYVLVRACLSHLNLPRRRLAAG